MSEVAKSNVLRLLPEQRRKRKPPRRSVPSKREQGRRAQSYAHGALDATDEMTPGWRARLSWPDMLSRLLARGALRFLAAYASPGRLSGTHSEMEDQVTAWIRERDMPDPLTPRKAALEMLHAVGISDGWKFFKSSGPSGHRRAEPFGA